MIKKYMVNNISNIILLCYILLFGRLLQLGYNIYNLNYFMLLFIFFVTLLMYYLYSKFLTTIKQRILFSFFIAFCITIFQMYKIINLKVFIDGEIGAKISKISTQFQNSMSTNFSDFFLLLVILIPIFLITILVLRPRLICINIVATVPIMLLFWNNGIDIKKYTIIYIILSLIDFSINVYNNSLLQASKKNYRNIISKEKILIYSSFMAIFTILFTAGVTGLFGTLSLSQAEQLRKSRIINEMDSYNNKYDISSSGYGSNSERLGGPIKLNYNLALKVKSDKPLYLRGNVLNLYNGHGWENSQYVFSSYKNEGIKAKVKSIEIFPQGLKTSSFFTPLNTVSIHTGLDLLKYNRDDIFYEESAKYLQDEYTVDYLDGAQSIYKNCKFIYGEDTNSKYKDYLQVPNSISDDTKNLVKEITKGNKTNIDKLNSIESYLKSNYKYSLDVNKVPQNKEFIDYFLFTEKKGYCTYFATAATIMARLAGIPARYTEGFSMEDVRDKDGLYLVGNNRAHAWSEVLVTSEDNKWAIFDCVPNASVTATNQHPINISPSYNNYKDTGNKVTEKIKVNHKATLGIIVYIKIFLFIVILGVAIIGISYLINRIIKNNRVKIKVVKTDSIIPIYYYSRKRIKSIGIEWKNYKSDMEVTELISDNELKTMFVEIVEIFYKEYYGQEMNMIFDKNKFYNDLERHIRKQSNVFQYWYSKLLK